ncbi:MAG: sigma-70 family RNA polymerase sigma factor [Bacteroidota bacterium]
MQRQEDDMAVIQMVLQGRQQAYTVLVERYQSYVFTLAMRYVDDRELAEEMAQDVFVKAYRYLADFKGASKFSTWLYTIVHTTCLSQLRKNKNNTALPGDEQLQLAAERHGADRPCDRLELKNQKHLLDNAISKLSETDSEVITLFYLSEQSLEEIAMIMGITPNLVKVRLFRARQKLKEILEPHYLNELQ